MTSSLLTFALAVPLLVACGSASPAPPDTASDASGDAVATTACNPSKPFGAPIPITELNTTQTEAQARLSHDELSIYFSRGPLTGGYDQLYVANRPDRASPFGPASPLAVNVSNTDSDYPSPTADGLTLYFDSDRTGPGPSIFLASRQSVTADFGGVTAVSSIDGEEPYVLPDGGTLYFTSATLGCGDSNASLKGMPLVCRAARAPDGSFAFDASGVLVAVNTWDGASSPVVTANDLVLYFTADRGDGWHVYRATRLSTAVAFGPASPVYELDSNLSEPGWISDDDCRMVLAEETAAGDMDLFIATRGR